MRRLGSVDEPGAQSVRRMLGIRPEDPRIFKPYSLGEAVAAARIICGDDALDGGVRMLVPVGLAYDLCPAHLMPEAGTLAASLSVSVRRIRRHRLIWETVDPALRFALVRRACRLILAWRGRDCY